MLMDLPTDGKLHAMWMRYEAESISNYNDVQLVVHLHLKQKSIFPHSIIHNQVNIICRQIVVVIICVGSVSTTSDTLSLT